MTDGGVEGFVKFARHLAFGPPLLLISGGAAGHVVIGLDQLELLVSSPSKSAGGSGDCNRPHRKHSHRRCSTTTNFQRHRAKAMRPPLMKRLATVQSAGRRSCGRQMFSTQTPNKLRPTPHTMPAISKTKSVFFIIGNAPRAE